MLTSKSLVSIIIASVMTASTVGASIASAEPGSGGGKSYAHNYCVKTAQIAFSGLSVDAEHVRSVEEGLLDKYNGDIRKVSVGEVLTASFPVLSAGCVVGRCDDGVWKIVSEDGLAASYRPALMDGINYIPSSYIATDESSNLVIEVNFDTNHYNIDVTYYGDHDSFEVGRANLDNTVYEGQMYVLTDSYSENGTNLYSPIDIAIYGNLIESVRTIKDYMGENPANSEPAAPTEGQSPNAIAEDELFSLIDFTKSRFEERFSSEAYAACDKISEKLNSGIDFRSIALNNIEGRDVARMEDYWTVIRVGEDAYIHFEEPSYDHFGVLYKPEITMLFGDYKITVFQENGEIQFSCENEAINLDLDGLGRNHITPQYAGSYYAIRGAGPGYVDIFDLAIIEVLASIAQDFNN